MTLRNPKDVLDYLSRSFLAVAGITPLVYILACILLTFLFVRTKRRHLRLPPGPRPLPFVGNIRQLPATYQEVTYTEWGKQYGDIVYARFFNTPVVVLNRVHIARALLDKRGAKYSGRPRFTYVGDIVKWKHLVMLPYDAQWRRQRRWFQTALLARNTLNSYEALQSKEVHTLLQDLVREPKEALSHVKRYAAALMLGVGYGYSPSSVDDEYIRNSEEAIHLTLDGGGPGAFVVDFFPALKYLPACLPGMEFKRRGLRARKLVRDMEHIPLERVKREMAAGTARACFGTVLLEEAMSGGKGVLNEDEEQEIASALGILYLAGTDTTTSLVSAFILLMVLHPDVLHKAQAEVDNVIGNAGLPALSDQAVLPYLDAVLKEVYRWTAPAPVGGPHQLTEEDEFAGFDMPKGSTVLANIWAMSRDEEHYPDPETFAPERFLGVTEEVAQTRDPHKFVFGFGRRICPGRVLADSSIFLAAANLVAVFDIRPARTLDGKEIIPVPAFTSGTVRSPKPYLCDISPRSRKKVDLVLGTTAPW